MNTRSRSPLTTLVFIALSAAVLAGCKKEAAEPEPEETAGAETPVSQPAPEPEPVVEQSCDLQTVYFAFDSAELDGTARATIQDAVECFRSEQLRTRLLLIGACDPRGTEEYNIALGERRASAVRSYMSALGLGTGQVSVTSVGEELATGTDEASWVKDRNVSATEN